MSLSPEFGDSNPCLSQSLIIPGHSNPVCAQVTKADIYSLALSIDFHIFFMNKDGITGGKILPSRAATGHTPIMLHTEMCLFVWSRDVKHLTETAQEISRGGMCCLNSSHFNS